MGKPLPEGVYPRFQRGEIVGFKVRWREQGSDGVPRNAAKSFSVSKLGTLDRARDAAIEYRRQAVKVSRAHGAVLRSGGNGVLSVGDLFEEWCIGRGPTLSKRYAEDAVRRWEREIASRSIARVRLVRLSQDPAIITRFHDELAAAGLTASGRAQVLKLLRAVLRWGRRRHPNELNLDLSGLFEIPRTRSGRLAYAADAYGVERIIEAVLERRSKGRLLPIRDAAFVAAMGFTIAARPSEWLNSATWGNLHQRSVELQRASGSDDEGTGLKTGARAALLLPNATDRIERYREELERRFGRQPDDGLVFQALAEEGEPIWSREDGERVPVAWSFNDYKRWTARVWRPARDVAAGADGVPAGLHSMRFYDCRHTAISMALHSTLVTGPFGMNMHSLAGWAGHDVGTLQRYYAHIIARYQGGRPIDLEAECEKARARVRAEPHRAPRVAGPQRAAQRRRRARKVFETKTGPDRSAPVVQ